VIIFHRRGSVSARHKSVGDQRPTDLNCRTEKLCYSLRSSTARDGIPQPPPTSGSSPTSEVHCSMSSFSSTPPARSPLSSSGRRRFRGCNLVGITILEISREAIFSLSRLSLPQRFVCALTIVSAPWERRSRLPHFQASDLSAEPNFVCVRGCAVGSKIRSS
jgi:hypothetical protein